MSVLAANAIAIVTTIAADEPSRFVRLRHPNLTSPQRPEACVLSDMAVLAMAAAASRRTSTVFARCLLDAARSPFVPPDQPANACKKAARAPSEQRARAAPTA